MLFVNMRAKVLIFEYFRLFQSKPDPQYGTKKSDAQMQQLPSMKKLDLPIIVKPSWMQHSLKRNLGD
ncbi:hypothetical protein DVR12_20670 [Chitinophaga silvatica]|uniref:Uncharacterized protein n=1 Tax=Chitinophaga silvatica TaxID=2282649 RepID=A0A3E1Y5Z8_9BACT|nr:hypothetical protein DVR12_20670 [Chitinophaga silvatica]